MFNKCFCKDLMSGFTNTILALRDIYYKNSEVIAPAAAIYRENLHRLLGVISGQELNSSYQFSLPNCM